MNKRGVFCDIFAPRVGSAHFQRVANFPNHFLFVTQVDIVAQNSCYSAHKFPQPFRLQTTCRSLHLPAVAVQGIRREASISKTAESQILSQYKRTAHIAPIVSALYYAERFCFACIKTKISTKKFKKTIAYQIKL